MHFPCRTHTSLKYPCLLEIALQSAYSSLLCQPGDFFFFPFPPFSCDPTLISLLRGEAEEGVPCSPHLSPLPAVPVSPTSARMLSCRWGCLITPSRLHRLTLTHPSLPSAHMQGHLMGPSTSLSRLGAGEESSVPGRCVRSPLLGERPAPGSPGSRPGGVRAVWC